MDPIEQIETALLVETHLTGKFQPARLADVIETWGVQGLSIAVLDRGEIAWTRCYGVRERGKPEPITADTLFQAASISKPVAAMAVMRLVEERVLDLDEDVNAYLRSWQVPPNGSWQPRLTLRQLLCHGAGTTVQGFPGYNPRAAIPAPVRVLQGEPPANTPPVLVNAIPGTQFRYSGGGTTIVQQVMVDVTGRSFPEIMRDLVLQPVGMRHSTYEQPLPENRWHEAARGHHFGGGIVDGGWHVYPEMAAAGLWTTPSDLLRLAMDIQRARTGAGGTLLTKDSVDQMLTPQVAPHMGIGFFLEGSGDALRFGHAGANEGFRSVLTAYADGGAGAAIMTNSDPGDLVLHNLVRTIAEVYGWKEYQQPQRIPSDNASPIDPSLEGEYRTDSGFRFTVAVGDDGLTLEPQGQPVFPLLASGSNEFFADVVNIEVRFDGDSLTIRQNDADVVARKHRVGD